MSNNKTLLILGNGFDLDLGLRTSFRDYLKTSSHVLHTIDTPTFRMIEDQNRDNWGDIEGILRESILNALVCKETKVDKEINLTWQLIRNGWGNYLPKYIDDVQSLLKVEHDYMFKEKLFEDFPVKKGSCAYTLAIRIRNWGNVFSFNYTNPADFLFGVWPNNIHFLHGSFIPHKHEPTPMYQIANFLAIGIDSKRINEQLIDRKYLSPIIKLNFVETSLFDELSQAMVKADNIIFFGHSMSITDSDYFDDFFNGMAANSITDKRLFFVTKNQKSMEEIKNNLKTWEIDYDELFKSKNCIVEIFTDNGSNNTDFKAMLDLL